MSEETKDTGTKLRPGIYEQILDRVVEGNISRTELKEITEDLDPADSHAYLSQFMARVLSQGLQMLRGSGGQNGKISKQIEICNYIIGYLKELELENFAGRDISPLARRLLALEERHGRSYSERPDTPLSMGSLLTGTRQDPSLVSQLKKEIQTSDCVDILCSFIKWSGVRVLQNELEKFTSQEGARLRVITTSYMGATDLKAVEFLTELPKTELKVSYNTRRTRLHAKAYLFHRRTGFNTAYVGSSNLSQAALTDGLEWNVKLSGYEQASLWDKVSATFETYWHDREFESYEASERKRLAAALAAERSGEASSESFMPVFDLQPFTFQAEILEKIAVERELHARNRHLIVAATGTGKTMLAAFDYKAFCSLFSATNSGRLPRLLFVAHREEILKQAMWTFRNVLRDQNFGDLLVGTHQPGQLDQLFVSIQSFNSKSMNADTESNFYDYIVIDEFHHACAPSYQALLDHYSPHALLGLTATPERADGLDVTQYFGGRISAEIRLPNAINRKLLCPFQYFAISDSIDYSSIKWRRGGYDRTELDNVLTGDLLRAHRVAEKSAETLLDVRRARGLGFCVSKAHAVFMAKVFNEIDIPACSLTADSPLEERNSVRKRLAESTINFIFVVDLFNEGVDIPEIDTVLFLRPTESLTVFLQQLGRGLRLSDGKDCLTVLDFVGQAHRNFRYDVLFRSLLTSDAGALDKEIEAEFPHLPSGCTISLERQSREYILENIRRALSSHKSQLVRRIASFEEESDLPLTLPNFLEFHRLDLEDIYKRASWSGLSRAAGVLEESCGPDEGLFQKSLRRLQHIDDVDYIRFALSWIEKENPPLGPSDDASRRRLLMIYFTFFPQEDGAVDLGRLRRVVSANPVLAGEMRTFLRYRLANVNHVPMDLDLPFLCPLQLHSRYSVREVRAALGHLTVERQTSFREGVLFLSTLPADVFFITLNKSESRYSPTTMYNDYAMDERLFHWQSQSTTSVDSPTGRRYIEHEKRGHTILLFVREDAKKGGRTMPYSFLGPAVYQSHEGNCPISFIWRLVHPMPAELEIQTERMVVF